MVDSVKVMIYIVSFVLVLRLMMKEQKCWLFLLVSVGLSIILLNTSIVDSLSERVKVIWACLTLAGCVFSYVLMTKAHQSRKD
ncbi:MAG TPA: hypothetical protein DCY20_11880 [Firmicutes bacterium]|nr:hypothetical protein [Bacillota bacterium]